MNILITGIGGFAGRYLAAECAAAGHSVFGYDARGLAGPDAPRMTQGDLSDASALSRAIKLARPDACVHLAGLASVPACARDPQTAIRVNVSGSLAVLDALRVAGKPVRLLFVSTAHVYGSGSDRPAGAGRIQPDSLYAVTKWTAEQALLMSARGSSVSVMSVRPVNHIGPGQTPDYVVSAFARQLAEMEAGRAEPVLRVGNLQSERDFLDVRDVVRAYRLLLERGAADRVYNLASNRSVPIGALLDRLTSLSGQHPRIESDPSRHRPTDRSPDLDTDAIRGQTGWVPTIPLDSSLRDIYADARNRTLENPANH